MVVQGAYDFLQRTLCFRVFLSANYAKKRGFLFRWDGEECHAKGSLPYVVEATEVARDQ
jgi:hypothetical protein